MRCETCKKLVDSQRMIVYNGKDVSFCSQTCYTSFLYLEKEKEDRNFLYKEICRIFSISCSSIIHHIIIIHSTDE